MFALQVPEEVKQLCDGWWVEGSRVVRQGQGVRGNYGPGLERLGVGDR